MLCNFCVDFSLWLTITIISVLAFLCLYVDARVHMQACIFTVTVYTFILFVSWSNESHRVLNPVMYWFIM